MIAAIYARKSTEQVGRAEDQKSVTRQIENAQEFAMGRGWTTDPALIFVDDGISGAEFERRPGFMRLMGLLKPRPPFQVLVVSEQKSIGRESSETQYRIKQLAQAGVEIVEYVHGRSLTPKTWLDKMTTAVLSVADEAHQRQSSERVTEAHHRLFSQGRVVGGRVFGYRNVDITLGHDEHGRPVRSHVEREINREEAAVVQRIFELFDSGLGLKAIAKLLTSEKAIAPRPYKRKNDTTTLNCPTPVVGWAPSTIRTILARDIYRGVIVWNKSRKRDDWGKVNQRPRPESEWRRVEAEHLRVISDDLWQRVVARRADTEGKAVRFASGRLSGRPPKTATKNLLAGLATCGLCGGGLVVETSARKNGRVPEYVCHRHRHNGTCSNALRMPVGEMNEAVLLAVEEHALTPEAVEQVIQFTERDDHRDKQDGLARDYRDVEKRIKRLVEAIETGGDVPTLVAKLRELEAKRSAVEQEIASLQPLPRLEPGVLDSRLAEWRRLLRQSTTQGRSVLQRVLRGRLTFAPRADGRGYDFTAPTRFDKLFSGIVVPRPPFVPSSRVGTEHIGPTDTLEADYGRLLERAHNRVYGKGVASPSRMNMLDQASGAFRRAA